MSILYKESPLPLGLVIKNIFIAPVVFFFDDFIVVANIFFVITISGIVIPMCLSIWSKKVFVIWTFFFPFLKCT